MTRDCDQFVGHLSRAVCEEASATCADSAVILASYALVVMIRSLTTNFQQVALSQYLVLFLSNIVTE